ncbi:translation initiation factor IF-2 N-terminal domain-containing protein, partial [Amycolatopsis sp. SID8362]|uniref:translation initiation factor IF-2 N-terminal domain-containing protein n=1 Tax=Amycolatopsis sp. SID8362 TaxID=2690346 RepID=UPI001EF2CFF7
MSNAETPAEHTGGNPATPTSGPLADLPARIRVHALAKLLESHSRDILAKLAELGESVRSAQSSVTREVALKVAEAFTPAEGDTGEASHTAVAQTHTDQAQATGQAPTGSDAEQGRSTGQADAGQQPAQGDTAQAPARGETDQGQLTGRGDADQQPTRGDAD